MRRTNSVILTLIASAGCAVPALGADVAPRIRAVALTGMQVPGMAPGVVYTDVPVYYYGEAYFSGEADVTFLANIAGPGVSAANSRVAMVGKAGAVSVLARTGSVYPGLPSGVYVEELMRTPRASAGQFAVMGYLAGPGITQSNDEAVWVGVPGSLSIRVLAGTQAPQVPVGVKYGTGSNFLIFSGGRINYTSFLEGPGVSDANDYAHFISSPGGMQKNFREGDAAPGIGGAYLYGQYANTPLNASGINAFLADLTGPGVNPSTDSAVYRGTAGNMAVAAREGAACAAAGVGAYFTVLGAPTLNGAGTLAFHTQVGGVAAGTGQLVLKGLPGSLVKVARAGEQVPGAAAGVVFSQVYNPQLTETDDTTFFGQLSGPGVTAANDRGVFAQIDGQTFMVARKGVQAPGMPAGLVFADFTSWALGMNDRGIVAFDAPMSGPGVTTANDRAIWYGAPGNLKVLAREGSVFEVAPGVTRVIDSIATLSTSSGDQGYGRSLINGGLIFGLRFTDGTSGVFVASLCPADYNLDGFVDGIDSDLFNNDFEAGNMASDYNGDGFVDGIDYDTFMNDFESGC